MLIIIPINNFILINSLSLTKQLSLFVILLLVISITVVIVLVVAANIVYARDVLTNFVIIVVIFIVFVAVITSLNADTRRRRTYALDSDSFVVACDWASLDLPSSTLPNTQHGHFSFNAKRYLGWLVEGKVVRGRGREWYKMGFKYFSF